MNEKKSFFQMRIAELPFITIFFLIVMYFNLYLMFPGTFSFSRVNFTLTALETTFILLLVTGQAVVILSGNVDLSIGAIVGTSAMIIGVLIDREVSLGVAIIVALLFCLVVGGINGLLVAKCKLLLPNTKSKFVTLVLLKLPSIVITFIAMRVVIGLRRVIGDPYGAIRLGEAVRQERSTFLIFFLCVLLLIIVLWIMLELSKTGKRIYALGSTLNLKELPAIDVILKTVKCYMISALCAGLAGLFMVLKVEAVFFPSPLFGSGVVEITILAAIIGGISIRGGQGIFLGVLIGVSFEQVLRTGLLVLRVHPLPSRTIILTVLFIFAVVNTAQSILIRRAREKTPSETPSTIAEDII